MVEIVLITGCATGIGRAVAENLAARRTKTGAPEYKVWATDYRLEGVKDLEAEGLGVAQLDVSSTESINAAVKTILNTDGRIDLLVCNAGVTAAGFLTELDYNEALRLFNVNLHGVFRTIQPVAKSMMQRRSGKIAVLGSVLASFVLPFNALYSGSKSAIAVMTESLRIELAPFGISVTTVCPAFVKSEIYNNAPVNYARYERPESFYAGAVDKLRVVTDRATTIGCTTAEAADDICKGLAKIRPPRYLYTGTVLFWFLFWGFIQSWFPTTQQTRDIQTRYELDKCAEVAPRQWAGPYVKPSLEGVTKQAAWKKGKEFFPAELCKEE